jgi:hypothetical protein
LVIYGLNAAILMAQDNWAEFINGYLEDML